MVLVQSIPVFNPQTQKTSLSLFPELRGARKSEQQEADKSEKGRSSLGSGTFHQASSRPLKIKHGLRLQNGLGVGRQSDFS